MTQQATESFYSPYRVLDLSDERGLLCGRVLGDFGADVIKIEKPGGDAARNIGPFYNDIIDPNRSLFWFFTNANKRGITLNIETADGQELFERLVRSADVVVESFSPGYMDSLGLGYAALRDIKPDIVMTSISPFGQTGPYAGFQASDVTLWAMGGMMYLCGDSDRSPTRISYPQSYFHGGLQGALGTVVALYHREMSGEGQHVDVSIQEAITLTLMNAAEVYDLNRLNIRRSGAGVMVPRPTPPGPLTVRVHWPCKDGFVNFRFGGGVHVGHVISTGALIKMMESEGMAGPLEGFDPRQFDMNEITQEEWDSWADAMMKFFCTKTKLQLLDEAVAKSIVMAPVNTIKDIMESPQLEAREYFVTVEHPELGDTVTYPGAPVKANQATWRLRRRAPLIGEHNEEIYGGELGFSKDRIILFMAKGVV